MTPTTQSTMMRVRGRPVRGGRLANTETISAFNQRFTRGQGPNRLCCEFVFCAALRKYPQHYAFINHPYCAAWLSVRYRSRRSVWNACWSWGNLFQSMLTIDWPSADVPVPVVGAAKNETLFTRTLRI